MSDNPMLLNPNNPNGLSVPVLAARTNALPVEIQDETRYYYCSLDNHHMHRTDGKRLAFVFRMLATQDVYDIKYLDSEISSGNPFVRKATDVEINAYNMRVDPKGTMAREMTPALEEKIRTQLEIDIKKAMEDKLNTLGISLTQEQQDQLFAARTSETNLAGVDALSRLSSGFTGAMVKTDSASVTMQASDSDLVSRLKGIAGSDKTTTGIASS